MRKLSIILYILFPAFALASPKITQSELKSHIEFLASPELAGRETASPGSETAARYIATRFQSYGLKTVTMAPAYFQQVPLTLMRPDLDQTMVFLEKNSRKSFFKTGEEIYFFPKTGDNEDIKSHIVFCGYGISATEYNYDDYTGVDVKGKIVVAFTREPQENDSTSVFNGKKGTKYSLNMLKTRTAEQKGAKALFLMEPPGKAPMEETVDKLKDSLNKPIYQLTGRTHTMPVFYLTAESAEQILGGVIDIEKIFAEIEKTLRPQSRELTDVILDIKIRFRDRVETQSPNVIGLLEGSDKKLRDEYLIIGAHYDHEGVIDGEYYPGADDNASGISALLELAEAYSAMPKKPRRSILFIAFAAEEKGTLGSLYYADNPLLPMEKAAAMFNMDEIGRNGAPSFQDMKGTDYEKKNSNYVIAFHSAQTPELKKILSDSNKSIGLKVDIDPNMSFYGNSDHYIFHNRGIPVVFYFTGFHKDYSTPSDTPDKINYTKLENITRLIFNSGAIICNNKKKLTFDRSVTPPEKKVRMTF